jgi:hypothetical protein
VYVSRDDLSIASIQERLSIRPQIASVRENDELLVRRKWRVRILANGLGSDENAVSRAM